MAKKQISNYKFFPGVVPPAYGQFPNAVALITANKDFVIAEASQYIKNQIAANTANAGSAYYGYVYTAGVESAYRINLGYAIDGYIHDLTYGGNSLSYANAASYYANGALQSVSAAVDVDVMTVIQNQITASIMVNEIDSTVLNLEGEPQVLLTVQSEAAAYAKFESLVDIVIDAIAIGLSSLPAPVAPASQGGALLPNAIFLLEANKRFIQEETIAYIQYNVDNNIAPYINYTYNAEKCRRDVSYILEGYISDLRKGGNRQTYFNAEKYWENGVPQVDGDRQPEIFAHTFIRDLINNFIWVNTQFTPRQILVEQVINLAFTVEVFATTRLRQLSNIILQVIEFGVSYLPVIISNRGFVKMPGFFKIKDLLLITNSSRNIIMYNFADDSLGAEITYAETYDAAYAGALYGTDKITTITFDIDTSTMMVTDNIQIFVEGKEQIVRMNSIATDAMERQKVGIPQSMLDADFEYGLQPTKWQAIALMRNYPSIYEIPGSDIPTVNVTTDASTGTAGVGASLITVTTQANHGLSLYDAITIKALSNSVQGFSRAEGSFLIAAVPNATQISFYAKAKVGTSNGEVLASTYTQLRKGGFYTGAAVGSPAFSVASGGSSGTITTSLITPSGLAVIGFSAGAPQIGAPLTGTGVNTGTQITAVTGSGGTAAATQLLLAASIGDTTVDVASTTGIGPGLVFDRGDGIAVSVNAVAGSTITLSGALTAAIIGTNKTYTALNQAATNGAGTGAQFSVSRSPNYSVSVTNPGTGYAVTNTVTIAGATLDGATAANNATITVTGASPLNTVNTLGSITNPGTGYSNAAGAVTTSAGAGTGLTVNTTTSSGLITAATIAVGGINYAAAEVITVGPSGRVNTTGTIVPGTGYYTAAALTTTGGSGSGLTVDIVQSVIVASVNTIVAGTGYNTANGLATTGGTGSGLTVNITGVGNVATVDTLVAGTGYATANGVATTGGSGSGLTVNIVRQAAPLSVNNIVAGTAYVNGNGLATTGGTGSGLTANITSTNGILTIYSIGIGTGYSTATGLTTTGGSGSGLTVNITVNGLGKITAVAINNAGTGYSVSDAVTVVQGAGTGGVLAVFSVGGGGVVTALDAITIGSGYTTASGLATSGGAGSGATVNITASAGEITAISISNAGTGYAVGNVLTVTQGGGSGGTFTVNTIGGGISAVTIGPIAGTGYTVGDTITVVQSGASGGTFDIASVTTGLLSVGVTSPGTGYDVGDTVTVVQGSASGGTFNVATVSGGIATVTVATGGSAYTVADVITVVQSGSSGGTFTVASTANGIGSITVAAPGSGYTVGNTITVVQGGASGGTFNVATLHTQAQLSVATVTVGGAITSATIAGTAVTAPTQNFISAINLSEPTTSQIASGNTGITFSAISTIEATFGSPHGFVPGNTITTQITSSGTGSQLAAGPFFVESVPSLTTLRYTARAAGTVANTLVGVLYGRPDSFFIHRPFDGGVQLGTAGPAHGATAIRMSKKYIRYQSGKGVMYNTGALFAPSYDLRTVSASGTAIGSIITIVTDDTDHGCQIGGSITISGVETAGYNGTYTVATIANERQLTMIAVQLLASATPILGNPCLMSVKNWHGSTVRAGIFDDQNGMFFQYDGRKMAVCRRSSTFQVAGTISINANSNTVSGVNTRFTEQLSAGDRIVIRGMTHVVAQVANNTSMFVTPDFRGVSNVSNVKITKVQDLLVPQEDWNLDTMNGSGPSGYNLDVTKMQMISVQHTWYGAGFIDFMLRGSEGNYVFVHRFRNSNVNFEAYMRTGNQPVRYEVINEGFKGRLTAAMTNNQTTVPMTADDLSWFPRSGTVYIDNEMISFTGNSGTALTGCTRAANLQQFVAGSSRSFSGGAAATHTVRSGVVLISNTVTPIISHWGSAFMIDGQFDSDRGYIFNYAATGLSVTLNRTTAFLIRLAPSVSNAIVGDLGERELLNRAQLLLSSIAVSSDAVAGGGALVIEGVLNPINYPINPANITWTTLITQASGGQPSFAQVASGGSVTWSGAQTTSNSTVAGAFTTTLVSSGLAPVTNTLTAVSFDAVTQSVTAKSFGQSVSAVSFSGSQPYGTSTIYQRATSTARNDILITNTEYDAMAIPVATGHLLTSANLTVGTVVTSVTRAYLGGIYTRIVMNVNASINSTAGTGFNVAIAITTTYGRALDTGRTDFLIPQAQYSALTSQVNATDPLTTATFLVSGRTVASVTENFVSVANVSYARIVMNSGATASSALAVSIGAQDVTVTITSSVAARFNTAVSVSRNDFLITQAQLAASTVVATDVLSAATVLTGGQSIGTITANFTTISGTAYARIIMSANGTATSTAGTGNNITVTSTSAVTSAYGSALSSGRTDFLVPNSTAAGSGIAVSDVLSAATFITAGQTISSITPSYVTISGTPYTRIVMSAAANSTSTAGSATSVTVTITAATTAATYVNKNYLFFTSATWLSSGATINTKLDTSVTSFPAGTSITGVDARTYGGSTVYRIVFSQASNTTISAGAVITWTFGAQFALPGEQVFSFISNPGETNDLSLESLKELTSTAIGGRGTFPNGPDVLAINVYKVAGTATPANIILRWSEAQA